MSNQIVQLVNDSGITVCADIDCGLQLLGFDLKNNRRFCRKCRVSNKTLHWKCGRCQKRMDNDSYRESRKYCKNCSRN